MIVTIVALGHILNLKKKLTLYMQYKLSSIIFKKKVRHIRRFRHICSIRRIHDNGEII